MMSDWLVIIPTYNYVTFNFTKSTKTSASGDSSKILFKLVLELAKRSDRCNNQIAAFDVQEQR